MCISFHICKKEGNLICLTHFESFNYVVILENYQNYQNAHKPSFPAANTPHPLGPERLLVWTFFPCKTSLKFGKQVLANSSKCNYLSSCIRLCHKPKLKHVIVISEQECFKDMRWLVHCFELLFQVSIAGHVVESSPSSKWRCEVMSRKGRMLLLKN